MSGNVKFGVGKKKGPSPAQVWDRIDTPLRLEILHGVVDASCPESKVKKVSELAVLGATELAKDHPCPWRFIKKYIEKQALKSR